MTIPITIKWAGNKPFTVDVDTAESGHTLKLQIYSLTGVDPDRQKILVKGGPLKDDAALDTLGFKAGTSLMMMGSSTALPQKVAQPKFVEDMDAAELAKQTQSPPGLENLGNTCYMNSTLQLLRKVPELQEELTAYGGGNLTGSLRDLYKSMSGTSDPIHPVMFLSSLRQAFPQFAERSRSGMGYAQQDAEECWSQIMHTLRQNLKPAAGEQVQSALDRFMGGKLQVTQTCDETTEEPAVDSIEEFIKLNCHISGTTNFMLDGIRDGLTDKVEKHSQVLGRNAVFTKKAAVSRLPKYLSVNFVRFFYKAGVQKKAKILRKVGFPFDLDATPICTEALQATMAPIRDRVREVQKQEEDDERARKRAKTQELASEVPATEAIDLQKEVDGLLTEEMKQDPGANHCGLYELIGVLTHSGASADSGHYQAWMKGDKDDWYRFNDDKVSVVTKEKIETLAGGGEADAIYIALYKSKF
ncbi:hypothetical protein BCR37DRAFT_343634 [Protomyces lactucae-debilis]|uniref:Ubiquitin carboxyl-terminal hydrolase n=1 Tax=Protomyces lactucae-debilis TaxID=2754530 RepID=A0A1Y2FSB6_PROLT|nr:uncharacterized protein BCR37DRAFT_343634 [Protomyces lactucae-debilis]ORY86900.1 hypothetical protein BCR37DRAFT_343634 [Protomyces lactucae-debilis]